MKKKQTLQKSPEDMKEDLGKAREELFALMLENSMKKLKNTRSLFLKRKEITQILTKMNMKEVINA